ncbi:NACHT and WD domain-containing protein [Colletotrichum tofieldiae]|nr:NACHT and WD domain-containing protein [Colletotrichum tofieldiae]
MDDMRYPATRLAFEFRYDRPTVEAQTQLVAGLRAGYTPMARRVASSKVGLAISMQVLDRHAVVTQSQRPKHSDMQCVAVSLTRRILGVQLTSQVHVGNLVPGLVSPPNPFQPLPPPQPSTTGLQGRLRKQVYDVLKSSDTEVVGAYEKLLSAKLEDEGSGPVATEKQAQVVSEERWRQMQRLIQAGLQRTENDAAVKQKISDGMQIASPVKALVSKAVQAAPKAAIAWVSVSFALEILASPLTEPDTNRDGISYIVSSMDWYRNLVDFILDEKRAGLVFEGLRGQLERHIVQLYQKLTLYLIRASAGQLNDVKVAEGAVRNDSEQYNSQQMRDRLQVVAATAELQYRELQGITTAIQDQTRRQEATQHNQEDKECLNGLFQTDPRHEKTRTQDTKGGLLRDSYS